MLCVMCCTAKSKSNFLAVFRELRKWAAKI
jgi:hypothetical protein